MRAEFGFDDAAQVADYLSALGVTHFYASPYLQAGPKSTHGYDVMDHTRPNEELGGWEGHARLCQALGENGLGQILDIVPNHMSIASPANRWWWDVLENGQASHYATYFDVDWKPSDEKLRDVVLMPILGDHYGREVEAGHIQLHRDGGRFLFKYFDHTMPVAPRSLNDLLHRAALHADSEYLAFLADVAGNLPHATSTDRAHIDRRHRDKKVLIDLLGKLCATDANAARAIDEAVAALNGSPTEVDALLERQNYRLAHWKTAVQELDYRRFFDINTLISLRMEDQQVFEDSHRLVLDWVHKGVLDGLRVDHPDGLRDPAEYFARLRQASGDAWVVVEKILEPGEAMPSDWPVAGTTGYDFLNKLGGLLVDPDGEKPITDFYAEFTGESIDYPKMVRDKKLFVLKQMFGSDIHRLSAIFSRVCEHQKRYRDYTRRDLTILLREVIACFPVYRTYVEPTTGKVSPEDVRYIDEAITLAKANRPEIDDDLLAFLRDLLTLQFRGTSESELVARFQQNTGPVMAKGLEDTVFYNYNRMVVLNEVGGDPGHFGMSLDEFHRDCAATVGRWGESMLTTTTHDTKRSEDTRARLALLAEIPDRWTATVQRWHELNARHSKGGHLDRNAEYLLYQILVGAWPIDTERATAYMAKATSEAKVHTSWTEPNEAYVAAVKDFVSGILDDRGFVAEVASFVRPLIEPGRVNSLSQALIKLTAPGVPDVYQGNELWDLSLVDPDNRRPVNFAIRRQYLKELEAGMTPEAIVARSDDGLTKLHVTRAALHLRRDHRAWFGREASYTPIVAQGAKADHVVAFERGGGAVTVAVRLPIRLGSDWGNTTLELPAGNWTNHLTGDAVAGGTVRLADLLKRFPVALLSRAAG